MPILNLGILAHVDAGKTSLTERILFETSVIDAIGRVDSGTTQTDTLDLERQRGITIQSAVVSFRLGDLKVNLIDTPGHADFIAEVERALVVLDGVVLVVSTVEGVQPQTRKLARAIRALGIPLLVFFNKIDRIGACEHDLPGSIRRRLGILPVAMNVPIDAGSRRATALPFALDDPAFMTSLANTLGETSDDFLTIWMGADGHPSPHAIHRELRRQVRRGEVAPAWYGSAMTGAGVDQLLLGIRDLLPRAPESNVAPPAGVVFKVQRTAVGEKLAVFRLFAGTLHLRERIVLGGERAGGGIPREARIIGIDRFDAGHSTAARKVEAGDIVRLYGLHAARIGDVVGDPPHQARAAQFAPPALESVVTAARPEQVTALYTALQHLAEQDPLIDVRRDDRHGELSVRLFGEVQKEVIGALLATSYGIEALFAPSRIICVERPVGAGHAVERMGEPANPFVATVGLRVDPGPPGSEIAFRRPFGAMPLAFYNAIEETVTATLREGLWGWQVAACAVTLTDTAFDRQAGTTASDFRHLTPLVLMAALRQAGTRVFEPIQRFTLLVPEWAVGDALAALAAARAIPGETGEDGDERVITGVIPAATVRAFEQRVPGLSGGDGVFTSTFDGYEPVTGAPPRRARGDFNPLHRKEYLARVSQT